MAIVGEATTNRQVDEFARFELENQGAIQNHSESQTAQIMSYLDAETRRFLDDPARRAEQTKRNMLINDPDTLHSLINDPFDTGSRLRALTPGNQKKIKPTIKMQPSKKRKRDIFVDKEKVEAIKRRESKQKFEERKQKLKSFFGFGASKPPVKMEQPRTPERAERPRERVPSIQGRQSRVRIFDEQPGPPPIENKTPEFYQMDRGGREPPKMTHEMFKKKAEPEGKIEEKERPPISFQVASAKPKEESIAEENPGFFERIKNYFQPKKEEKKAKKKVEVKEEYSDEDEAGRYVESIRNQKLNFDYSKSYERQIPQNVDN